MGEKLLCKYFMCHHFTLTEICFPSHKNRMNSIAIRTRPCVLAWFTVVIQNQLWITIYIYVLKKSTEF